MYTKFGYFRCAALTPAVSVGNPQKNAAAIIDAVKNLDDHDLIVTPELSITGYTCGDLFGQEILLRKAWEAVLDVATAFEGRKQLLIVGVPVRVGGALYNCAAVLGQGCVLGVVPKQYLPNYKEFYEGRWFKAADGSEPQFAQLHDGVSIRDVPFGVDLLFRCDEVIIGVEICEDLWVPTPPSSFQAVAGANVLVNLSASNELVGKGQYRCELVRQQSARCVAAYLYCSAGPLESTTGLVFGGHNLIAENGVFLSESLKFVRASHHQTADVDLEKLTNERAKTTVFSSCRSVLPRTYRFQDFWLLETKPDLLCRLTPAAVFVPSSKSDLNERCDEIFNIQCCGLAKRLESLPVRPANVWLGVSGGLDSTLALLVACKTYDLLGWPRGKIHAVAMPGFGTTDKTRNNAASLIGMLEVYKHIIDIRPLSMAAFDTLGHKPFGVEYDSGHQMLMDDFQAALEKMSGKQDLVFENIQARLRTFCLMSSGFVLGTGDMSELALGWCTYNGDHMSNYNVNCGVPKTLVKFLVRWVAENASNKFLAPVNLNAIHPIETKALISLLLDICSAAISPELLPGGNQNTEELIGPYELHDFFLLHLVRNGFSPEKTAFLAARADGFSKKYTKEEISKWLGVFLKRFFANQFKRDCVPAGPKIGSVSLDPRGDWRMPADCDPSLWLEENL